MRRVAAGVGVVDRRAAMATSVAVESVGMEWNGRHIERRQGERVVGGAHRCVVGPLTQTGRGRVGPSG